MNIDYRNWQMQLKRKDESRHRCSKCDGYGKVIVYHLGHDWETVCVDCEGTGTHLMRMGKKEMHLP